MKKLSKIFICLSLVLASCFTLIGCGENPPDTNRNEYQNTTINNTNYSEFLSLDAFLYYTPVNTDFYFKQMPCFDWAYKDGNIKEEYLGENVIDEDFKKPTISTFFSDNNSTPDKRWKVVSFKALKDLKVNSLQFTIDRNQGVIINSYITSIIITTPESTTEYIASTIEAEGYTCRYTFRQFWYPDYPDIVENQCIYLPKDSTLTILFNDIHLIKDTYSEEESNRNGSSSKEYSTNEEREFALKESIKCFNICNMVIVGQYK